MVVEDGDVGDGDEQVPVHLSRFFSLSGIQNVNSLCALFCLPNCTCSNGAASSSPRLLQLFLSSPSESSSSSSEGTGYKHSSHSSDCVLHPHSSFAIIRSSLQSSSSSAWVGVEMAGSKEHFQDMESHSELEAENDGSGKEYVSTLRRFSSIEYVDMCEGGKEVNATHSTVHSGMKQEIDADGTSNCTRKETVAADGFTKKISACSLPSISELNSCTNTIDFLNGSDNDDSSDSDSQVVEPLLETVSLRGFSRLKSRFQDPPPLTPAVMNQLTYCSSFVRRRASANASPEFPVNTPSAKEDPPQEASAEAHPCPAYNLSKSNSNRTEQEEQDPFLDDFVPEDKKEKEKENKWLISVQWCGLFILMALLISSVEIPILEKVLFLGLNLWRWQALALVILCGHLISGWIMKLFVSLIEKHYILKKKVLYFVYGLRNCVKNSIWLALVVGVWGVIFQGHEDTTAVSIVSKILWCLFTASLSWMIKILVVKVAASNFHRTAYFEKIQECLFNQYLLEKLSGPPTMANFDTDDGRKNSSVGSKYRKNQRGIGGSFTKRSEGIHPQKELLKTQSESHLPQACSREENSTTVAQKRSLNSKLTGYWQKGFRKFGNERTHHSVIDMDVASHVPNTPKQDDIHFVPQMSNLGKSAKTLQHEKLQGLTSETVSVFTLKRLMKIVRNTNLRTYSSLLSHDKEQTYINSEAQAKAVARQIYHNMARPGQKYITITNFLYFLDKDQAFKAFGIFEATETGEITKHAFAKWVVNAYKERKALGLTLNDNKTIIEKLHTVLNGVLGVILVAAFVLIFGVDTSKVLLFVSSIILPSVFMFGNAAKVLFESLIFLFVTHPFDVGDRISVDGQTMLVEEMNILHTILLSTTYEKVYYPNFLLAAKPISNFYRSPDQWESIDFQIHMNTPLEKLSMLKERIQKYIEGLPQIWYPEFRMACKDIEDSNKMLMGLWPRHRLNYQEGGERLQRRSGLLFYLKQQLEELDISYQLPQQQIIVTGVPAARFGSMCDL